MSKLKILSHAFIRRWRQLCYLKLYEIAECKSEWFQPPETPPLKNKVILIICGFGGEKYRKAAQRLAVQASSLKRFSKIHVFTELDDVDGITIERKFEIKALAERYVRGWGLWAWKPAVVAGVMNKTEEDAEIFYLDAGCEISPWGGILFDRWRAQLQSKGTLFFSIPYKECEWTSESVLKHFGFPVNLETHQIQATWFGLINNSKNRALMERWASECLHGSGRLLCAIGDDFNRYLLEHREDQSVLSCLIRSTPEIYVLEHQDHFLPELYYSNSWVLMMPIHTLRRRDSSSLIDKIILESSEGICRSRAIRPPRFKSICRALRFFRGVVGNAIWSLNFFWKNL